MIISNQCINLSTDKLNPMSNMLFFYKGKRFN